MSLAYQFSTRFNDTPLAFGMRRYDTPDKRRSIWRFEITRYCGAHPPLVEIDADRKTLLEMKLFIEQALEAVSSARPVGEEDE